MEAGAGLAQNGFLSDNSDAQSISLTAPPQKEHNLAWHSPVPIRCALTPSQTVEVLSRNTRDLLRHLLLPEWNVDTLGRDPRFPVRCAQHLGQGFSVCCRNFATPKRNLQQRVLNTSNLE